MEDVGGPSGESAADRCVRLLQIAIGRYRSGNFASAVDACLEVAEVARRLGRMDLLAEAALVVDGITDGGEIDAAVERLAREAVAGLGEDHPALRAQLLGQLSVALHHRGELEEAAKLSHEAVGLAEASGDRTAIVRTMRARQMSAFGPGGGAEVARLGARMIELSLDTGEPDLELWGRVWRIEGLTQLADDASIHREMASLRVLADRTGDLRARMHLLRAEAGRALGQGRWSDAQRSAGTFAALAPASEHLLSGLLPGIVELEIATRRGGEFEVEPWEDAMHLAPYPLPRTRLARYYASVGRTRDAARHYAVIRPRLEALPNDERWLATMTAGAELAIALDDQESLAFLWEALSPYANEVPCPALTPMSPVAEYLGMLAAARRQTSEAIRQFEVAIATAGRAAFTPAIASAQVGLAEALVSRNAPGDVQRAWALLGVAEQAARRFDLQPLHARLRRVGAELGLAASPRSSLSSREREVVALVAKGRSNRAIADDLVLSERTVESHVQNALGKLGFHSRAQLAAWAVAEGLLDTRATTAD